MLALLATVLLAGCSSGEQSPEPTVAPTATAMATPEPTPAMSMGEVQWATSLDATGEPLDPTGEIPRDVVTIYATVNVVFVQPGTSFTATWSIDGTPADVPTESVVADEGAASGWIAFSLTWNGDALWPVGPLGVTIAADSGETVTGKVQIVST